VICGCSKPEPPKPGTDSLKKKTTVKSIWNVHTVTPETYHADTESWAMGTVHVIDADSGLPITHATVRLQWESGGYPKMCFGRHTGDGEYCIPTNGLKGTFYVGAHADGYLPDDKESPPFPVELLLKKGDIIAVFGTIHHANGNPVTNGIINLIMKDIAIQNTQWHLLSPCSVMPDSNGTFFLPHVPAGIDEVYVKYDLPDDTIVEFKDQVFSTSEGDVHLTLLLPPELFIKGSVLFSSGSAVSGAWVWTEKVTGEMPDAWNMKLTEQGEAVNGVAAQTDENGFFELKLLKVMDRYIIKAFHPLYAVAYSGPYSDSVLPPEPVELIIQEDGARLYGRLCDTAGKPVTNCEVRYNIFKRTAPNTSNGKINKLLLDIAEDGNYISGIIPPGSHEITFTAGGHYPQSKNVIIQENLAEQCDIEFLPYCVVTGIVYDAETMQPIPDVKLINKSWRGKENHTFSAATDHNGKFWVLNNNSQMRIEFHHPSYAPALYRFYNYSNQKYESPEQLMHELNPEIYLSKSGTIRVFGHKSDGTPLDGYRAEMAVGRPVRTSFSKYAHFDFDKRATFIEGEALLTNVYVMFSPVYVEVYRDNYIEPLAKSDMIDIVAGEEVSVTVTLPPTGELVLNFLHPIDYDIIKINGKRIINSIYGISYNDCFNKSDFTYKNQQLTMDCLPTNMYQISIKDKDALSLKTNVLITANTTTEVMIDNNTNAVSVIRGSVTTCSGGIIQCLVSLNEPETGKQIDYEWLHDNRVFTFNGLSRVGLYNLTVNFYETSMTNITFKNITPNGPPIDIKLPDFYRITGNVVDDDGNPLKAQVGIKSIKEYGPGEFTLYYVFSGTHTLCINPSGYPMVEREVTVYDSNVDVGDIVISDKGITLSGRVVTPDNSPAKKTRVIIRTSDGHNVYDGRTDKEGCYRAQNLPREKAFSVRVYNNVYKTEPLSSDTDIGDIMMKP
jgi:hypothetical protein